MTIFYTFFNRVDYRHALPIDPITGTYRACLGVRRRVAGVGLYGTPAFTKDELTQLVGDCEKKTKMHPLNMNLTTDTTTEAKQ